MAVAVALVVVAGEIVAAAVPDQRVPLTRLSLTLLDVLGVVFSLFAARHGTHAMAWRLVAASRCCSLVANVALGEAAGRTSVWWWVGGVAGVAFYALLALAAVSFPAARLFDRQRWALAGEVVAVLGCGFMVVWYFVFQPHLSDGESVATALIHVGFPIGDLLLLIGVSVYLLRGGVRDGSRPASLLIGGIGLFLLADVAFNAIGDDGDHATGPMPATVAVIGSFLAMTVAAVLQTAARPAESDRARGAGGPLSPRPAALPYVAVALGFLLMIIITLRENQLLTWGGQVIGLLVMAGGIAIRQVVSLRDSRQYQLIDSLTGLADRTGLRRTLDRALRQGENVGVLAIDLDGFKNVNDTYGHSAGDIVLLDYARLLRSAVRPGDLCARAGGDEFLVLLRDINAPEDARAVGERLCAAGHAAPVRLGHDVIVHRASIGVATSMEHDTGEDLLRRADLARYHSQRAGTHGVAVHDPAMIDRRGDDAILGHDLERAVARGELQVLYQPMINLGSGRPVGAEALVRWHHPTRGLVSPLDFIPLAERTGAINDIGLYVLEQTCRQARRWQKLRSHGGRPLRASVNLSPRQLQDSSLVEDVITVLERVGLDPHDLILEVTESAITDQRIAIPALQRLRAYGVLIAVDDFGTGYSCLQHITRLPVDILKIDRSLVAELNGTSEGSVLTEAVIRLSQVLHLATVAEGVETAEQAAELAMLGCETGQGYLFARPLPAADAAVFLAKHPASTR